jgi:hypothetical protein
MKMWTRIVLPKNVSKTSINLCCYFKKCLHPMYSFDVMYVILEVMWMNL